MSGSEPRAAGYDTISLLTDYGSGDEFVGVVKAVLRDLAPHAAVIDLTHEIAPYDVRAGSLALARCIGYVPRGVVVAVVDPGVGTSRRAVAVEVAGGEGVLVGPDNGLLAPAVAMAGGAERAVELTDPGYHLEAPGPTFAGRDVFAPVAAHLCNGVPLEAFGESVDPALLMPATVPLPRPERDGLVAEVLWVDRYGNCQLNLGPDDLAEHGLEDTTLQLEIASPVQPTAPTVRAVTRARTFADVGGGIGLVLDAYGMLALCLDRASAAGELGLAAGDQVLVRSFDADAAPAARATPVRLGPTR
jgi:S-adenosylmethionine hydrolase